MKKTILRKDILTGKMLPTNELIRVVKTKNGEVFVDVTKKINGRGVYLQPNLEGLDLIKKKRLLERGLKINIDEKIFADLKHEIETNWD